MVILLLHTSACIPTNSFVDVEDGAVMHHLTGIELILRLTGNPSTGYRWQVENSPLISRPLGECPNSSYSEWAGHDAYICVGILGEKAGTYSLTFLYRRPWEIDSAEIRRITLILSKP